MGNAVLIVDGCDDYREGLVSFFREREFYAEGCGSFAEAIARIATQTFDVVITDFFIGSERADRFFDALAERRRHETVLVITSARHTTRIELDIRKHAPAFYFIKPVMIDNLYAVVLKIFESRNKKALLRKKALSAITH